MIETSESVLIKESTPKTDSNSDGFKLTNRGNKLVGPENPGNMRPKMWKNDDLLIGEEDFEAFERGFLRTVKYSHKKGSDGKDKNGTAENVFVRFLNEFEQNSGLFAKEDIKLEKIFRVENLLKTDLSNYTKSALQSRHLTVLTSLLMHVIEKEQEEYRKLMKLAEFLSIDEFKQEKEREEDEMMDKTDESNDLMDLKALCHEHLHVKRLYVSMLRKVRSGAVYALFQGNNLYMKLSRINRKLIKNRSKKGSDDEKDAEDKKEELKTCA